MGYLGTKPANQIIDSTLIADGTVTTSDIADGAITAAKIASGAVSSLPSGTVIYVAQSTAPSGYIKANGAAVSRTTYAALFSAIGTTFGSGDGSTTFNVPDLRGEFVRGWDDSRGVDASRSFGSSQSHGIPRLRGGVTDSHGNAAMGAYDVAGFTNPFVNAGGDSSYRTALQAATTPSVYVEFDSARVIPASNDVRPRNIALLACIKF